MPRYIVKIKDYYLEWSTVTDAPVTLGMRLEEFIKHFKSVYENKSEELAARLREVEEKGIDGSFYDSPDELIDCNRAGQDEKKLTKSEILYWYCERGVWPFWSHEQVEIIIDMIEIARRACENDNFKDTLVPFYSKKCAAEAISKLFGDDIGDEVVEMTFHPNYIIDPVSLSVLNDLADEAREKKGLPKAWDIDWSIDGEDPA